MLVLVLETHFVKYFNEIGNDALNCDSQIQFDVQLVPKKIIQNNTRQVTRSLNDKFTSKLLLYHHNKAAFKFKMEIE